MQFQQRVRALFQTYPTQLAIGLFLLIVASTLSAGVPAYWLTQLQLNAQVATHMRDAQQATSSLLQNEERRLQNIALLLSQRPTLASLLTESDQQPPNPDRQASLVEYVHDFQAQIGLDLLIICAEDGAIMAASLPVTTCPSHDGYLWIDEAPALVASHPLVSEGTSAVRGLVVTGMWLDDAFFNQLAAGTGVQQSLVAADSRRLVSSLDLQTLPQDATLQLSPATPAASQVTPTLLQARERAYYRLVAPLVTSSDSGTDLGTVSDTESGQGSEQVASDEQALFYSEILLAADELVATRNRVLGILLTSTGIVAALGVTLGLWSIRRITSPLNSLTAQAERISQGEFETPISDFGGPAEVRTLTAALQRSQASVVQALEDRAAARDRLDGLVQSLVEGVVIIDDEGKITFWNQGAALITGWPAEQALGKSLDQVLPTLERHQPTLLSDLPSAGQRRRLSVLTSGGKSSVLEVTSVRSAGNALSDTLTGTGLEERALVLRDVTEEEAMHHLRAYFLANISHEFRTPLSTLNASMELLMDESEESSGAVISGAEMRALLKPIHLSLLELQTLIDNLLEGSTIEAGEFRLRKRSMNINEAITGALNVVQPMFERRRQTLSVTEPAKLGQIWADRVRLTQVLVNLLANASKYTPMGEAIDMTVEVRAAPPAEDLHGNNGAIDADHPAESSDKLESEELIYRVMVADRGPGISETERVNLFRRFVRLESSSSGKGKEDHTADVHGTGIGLYVVKTTIEAHDGRVGIEERPGGGSIFWFEIPRGHLPE